MIRRLIRLYKTIKETNEAQIKANYMINPELKERELDGITYFSNDIIVKASGARVAYTAKTIYGETIILTDNDFDTYPKDVRKFILYHEIGHQINGDLDRPVEELQKVLRNRNRRKVSEMELKADEYALSKTDLETALKVMDHLIDLTKRLGLSSVEIKQRRKHLIKISK